VGFLVVDGFELHATGKFWVEWVSVLDGEGNSVVVPILDHKGWYSINDNG